VDGGGGVVRGEESAGGWWRSEGSANGGSGREGWIEEAEEKSRGARRRDKWGKYREEGGIEGRKE
jgi:hypothetical protein